MKKLVRGIVQFRRHVRPDYREAFARLALGQAPDALLIACSDSRVVPNLFASADPGDLFVVRNVGNLVAPAGGGGAATEGDRSEAAAIEFALAHLPVTDIIVCGHSECGAMQALLKGRDAVAPVHLREWLRHADEALRQLEKHSADPRLARHNQLSQLNVLTQIEHLKTYAMVQQRVSAGTLRLHGWWFELHNADVYAYDDSLGRFVVIDEPVAERLLQQLDS